MLDMRGLSAVTDFFVICTAASTRQIAALKDHIEATLHQHGCSLRHSEGVTSASWAPGGASQSPQWVLLDFGEIVVHLFDQDTRTFYRLEHLWADAPRRTFQGSASARTDP